LSFDRSQRRDRRAGIGQLHNKALDHTADSRADASASVWSGQTLAKGGTDMIKMTNARRSPMGSRTVVMATWLCLLAHVGHVTAGDPQVNAQVNAIVTDKGGQQHKITQFRLVQDYRPLLSIQNMCCRCGELQGGSVDDSVFRLLPLSDIREIQFVSEKEVRLIRVTGATTTERPSTTIRAVGTENLGDFGFGEFVKHGGMAKIEIIGQAPSVIQNGSLPVAGAGPTYRGTIVVGGRELSFEKLGFYYQTTEAGCTVHADCPSTCPNRYLKSVGNIAADLTLMIGAATVNLPLSKVRTIQMSEWGANPKASVTLKSGATADATLTLLGSQHAILAQDREGLVFIPLRLVTTIEFH